ncbi:MAG: hypothetical protein Q4C70_07045 [Planctomycetia bacterium]|nr:hypothetical protein [Planctomycetia bacterium]
MSNSPQYRHFLATARIVSLHIGQIFVSGVFSLDMIGFLVMVKSLGIGKRSA